MAEKTIANSSDATKAEIVAIANTGLASSALQPADVGTAAAEDVGYFATAGHNHAGVYEPADATILKDAHIGGSIQAYDAATAKTDTAQVWTAQQNFQAVTTATSSNVTAWNLATAQVAKQTLSEDTEVHNPTNIVEGGFYAFMFTQAAAASYQVTWDTAYVFPGATPAVKQEYDSVTVYTFIGGPSNTMLASAGPAAPTIVQSTATSWTPSLDDAESLILLGDTSAVTATIPANASVPYPIGTTLSFMNTGSSTLTIAITSDTLVYDDTGLTLEVTLYGIASATKITATSGKSTANWWQHDTQERSCKDSGSVS